MASFNQVVLLGYLTRDPELRYTPSNMATAAFGIGVNEKRKDKDEVSFFDIETWDKVAENCSTYLKKGSLVLISGRLKQDRWEDEHGDKKNKIKIIANTVQFLNKKEDNNNNDNKNNNNDPPF